MSIECVICCAHLQSSEAVYNTPCGHVFHQTCLTKWFERSKTCPECRQKVAESKINRIYLHYVSRESVIEEITSSLQSVITNINHELLKKEIDIIESQANNSKLSTLLRSKESEIRKLEADIWIAREHNRLWKNHAQGQIAALECSRKEVARLTHELEELRSSQTLANEYWNKVSNIFLGVSDYDTIIKMISHAQSELASCISSRYELERTVARLEHELEIDCYDRMFVTEERTRKRQLEDDLACAEIEKIALRRRIEELEEEVRNSDDKLEILEDRTINENEPVRKKLKVIGTPLDIIDLTEESIKPFVDLTNEEPVIS